jgi:hypothetical protein
MVSARNVPVKPAIPRVRKWRLLIPFLRRLEKVIGSGLGYLKLSLEVASMGGLYYLYNLFHPDYIGIDYEKERRYGNGAIPASE